MIQQIRRLLHQSPFKGFTLNLADGRVLAVSSPDGAWVTPNGAVFYWHQTDESAELINPLLIQGVPGEAVAESE